MTAVPPLPPRCGSWVIIDRESGQAVLETFSRSTAEAVNQDSYRVVTALDWLQDLNRKQHGRTSP